MAPHDLQPASDPITVPDTSPDSPKNELTEAVEWLRKAGIVTDERPAFASFYDELVENTDTGTQNPAKKTG